MNTIPCRDNPRTLRLPRIAGLTAALAIALPGAIAGAATPAIAAAPTHPAASIIVGNCNDSGAGSLRDAVASAASGDMVDLSQLTCSTITLTSGAIEIPQDDLYLKYSGEGGTPPTIDGNSSSRVFHHTGYGTLRIVGLTITHGKYDNTNAYFSVPASGGCVYSNGSVYLAGSTVTGCEAKDTRGEGAVGGGIYTVQALTLFHSTVSGNTATSTARYAGGGGAFAHGAVNSYYSSVSDNVSSGLGYNNFGGGIEVANRGTALSTIANSTINGNSADRGGGLLISGAGNDGAAVLIENSTISGNTANVYAAAAYLRGPVTIANSTIAFNQSASGPDVEFSSHTDLVEFESSIFTANGGYTIGSQGYAITISGANNLVVGLTDSITLPPGTLGADPLLQPLADNGGPTLTHALGDGSPAIDAGNNAAGLATDQRGNGYPRVFGANADIGAFERQSVDDTIFADGFDQ